MFLRHTYLVFDADNGRLAMAQAAQDPGNGPITPSRRRFKRSDNIIPIPAGTDLIPGAVWADPVPTTSPSPASSQPASSEGPSSSTTGSVNPTSGGSSSMFPRRSSGIIPPVSSVSPRVTERAFTSASVVPIPRPASSSALSGVDVSIDINFNQTIFVDSPEYGAAGFGWWSCSEESLPENTVEMLGGNGEVVVVPQYEAGTCVVNVGVMEFVYLIGGVYSTETQCYTTYVPRKLALMKVRPSLRAANVEICQIHPFCIYVLLHLRQVYFMSRANLNLPLPEIIEPSSPPMQYQYAS